MTNHYLLITNLVWPSLYSLRLRVMRSKTCERRFGCAYPAQRTHDNRLVDKKAYLCVTKLQRYPIVLRTASARREEGMLWNEQI